MPQLAFQLYREQPEFNHPYSYVTGGPVSSIDPFGLYVCYFSISGARLVCYPEVSGNPVYGQLGWGSGYGGCMNDPNCFQKKNEGPTPPGCYSIGNQKFSRGRWRFPLTPFYKEQVKSSNGGTRTDLQIHGCGSKISATCSIGCIVNNDAEYKKLSELLDREMSNVMCVTP